jgi:4-amino-4-deoxy-L-arabinose transferase-like glycosyltransferase
MLKINKNKIIVILIFVFIFIGLTVRNLHLSSVPFYDWDEGMYAQIAKEIISNKSIFTTFNGQVWLDKPPLAHILVSGTFLLFGLSEFWARMSMVVLAFILLILTYLSAKKLFSLISSSKAQPAEELMASLIPVLILASSPVFMDRSAILNSDTLIAIGWMGYLLYRNQYWLKLFFLTLGVWSKSVLGLYPLFIDAGITLFKKIILPKPQKQIFNIRKKILFLLLPSLWYIAGLLKYGQGFIYNHFQSQVLKRISVPIELHIGNKFYYLVYLWEKMGLMNVLFVVGYILFLINVSIRIFKEKKKFFDEKNILIISLLCAPAPFFIFLTFMKTKIYWYVIMFFPFICLSTLYIFIFLKKKVYKMLFFTGVVVYFLFSFSSQTFFSKTLNDSTERIDLAKCIAKTPYDKVAFLVDDDERKIRNVLEAAHYDTTSSFFYGGSPSFVYYIQRKVDYFYFVEDFIQKYRQYPLLIISKKDIQNNLILPSLYLNKKIICNNNNWLTIVQ